MSQDDIVFDDVKYREPERRRRPDRDRRWACLAYEVPGPDDLPIFLDRLTADAIERHALRDTTVELGGILLGKECIDDKTGRPFVWVTNSLEAKHFENTEASFTYTHDAWEEITRERDRLHSDLDIVGWYHTHPDFGVFLSGHDVFIHRHFFGQPLQVAYVVDPIRQTRGFFQWRGDALEEVSGYHVTADRGDRIALARLVNDLENFPNTEGGGAALSPRLEAELIAMLTRPPASPVSAADRTQTAALFGLLGVLVGVLGLAAVFWINHLNHRVEEQTQALRDLEKSSGAQRLAIDAMLSDAGGGPSQRISAQYDLVTKERDTARRMILNQEALNDAIAARARGLEESNKRLLTELDAASKLAKANEKEAKDAPLLHARVEKLVASTRDQARKLAEQEELIDASDTEAGALLLRKYERAWYAAIAGWGVGLLLALGLVATILFQQSDAEPGSGPKADEPPPHAIT